jgi:hypothetical protein
MPFKAKDRSRISVCFRASPTIRAGGSERLVEFSANDFDIARRRYPQAGLAAASLQDGNHNVKLGNENVLAFLSTQY